MAASISTKQRRAYTGSKKKEQRHPQRPPQPRYMHTQRSSATVPAPTRHRRVTHPPASNKLLNKLAPGYTLGQIARGVNLNVEYISRIFNHKRTPSLHAAIRIADFLNVGLDKFRLALDI